jgi:hypothetical protein
MLQPSSFEGDVFSVLALESACNVTTAGGQVITNVAPGDLSRFIFFFGEWRHAN